MRTRNWRFTLTFSFLLILLFSSPNVGHAKDLTSLAKQQIGVPYQWGGTTPNGFDCSGFIRYVFNGIGVELPRTAAEQYSAGKTITRLELSVGDLVFFETYKPGPSHSGIYLGNGQFIHASSSKGITISPMSQSYWANRYIGAKRVLDKTLEKANMLAFSDVTKNYWAFNEITSLNSKGIISGYAENQFKPENILTKIEAASILSKATGLDKPNATITIKDISENSWKYNPAAVLVENGWDTLSEDGTFHPDKNLTRSEMAAFLTKAFNIQKKDTTDTYQDVPHTHPAFNPIQALSSNGVVNGKDGKNFMPDAPVTRAEFTVALFRVLNVK